MSVSVTEKKMGASQHALCKEGVYTEKFKKKMCNNCILQSMMV